MCLKFRKDRRFTYSFSTITNFVRNFDFFQQIPFLAQFSTLIGGDAGRKEEVYKGCSTFYLGETTEYHNDTLENGIEYSLAKQTCRGEDCNVGHDLPDEPSDKFMCHQCTIQKDHLGNTIGIADESCWKNPNSDLLGACPDNSVCITEMLVDWYPRGEQAVTFHRKCGVEPTEGHECLESDYSLQS